VDKDIADLVAAAAATGHLDILVNNAGVALVDMLLDAKVEDWDATMAVNLRAPFLLAREVVPGMMAQKAGKIINVSSQAGVIGLDAHGAYCASKAAVIALCESLKFELDGMGIRLQLCCPGFVRTPLTDRNPFPMPHLMEPEDAAREYWRGLQGDAFEITFPKVFTRQLKALRLLPYSLYFKAVAKATGVRT
jgi:NAD(P)-dependent dehydrogenase (short-subunit alcohol dehydrogenase family)